MHYVHWFLSWVFEFWDAPLSCSPKVCYSLTFKRFFLCCQHFHWLGHSSHAFCHGNVCYSTVFPDPCLCFLLFSRFIQGTSAETPYAFYHWHYIDIFNYFTHNLVTIPPAVWTNTAHKHGVIVLGESKRANRRTGLGPRDGICFWEPQIVRFVSARRPTMSVLECKISCFWLAACPGTFITEWTDGATTCEAFLKDEESYRAVADKLVQISYCYGFDGWLINIENALSVSVSVLLASNAAALKAGKLIYFYLNRTTLELLFTFLFANE